MRKSKNRHDFIRVYKYGDCGYKYVYFKYLSEGARRRRGVPTEQVPVVAPVTAKAEGAGTETGGTIEPGALSRFDSSISRTRSLIFEIALCNNFEYFCTFTQDMQKVNDRFDLSTFRARLSQFVRNQNRYRSAENKIEYLLIPEQHKDGAWHMHGLIRGLTDDDLKINEHGYLDWYKYRDRFGFFSCSRIKSHEACSRYITKYVSKSLFSTNVESGGHMFFASKGLRRKECVADYDYEHGMYDEWDFENDYVKIRWQSEFTI